ncbi:hypothetical protein ACFFNX_01260 [Actinoallomurus acaciae]|uniref:Uncharacterized protein n=1 Tax=Actinoallomurus acaciae TaxID=502577 RepID=A0ABV5Y732_9ACTN
MHPFKPRGAHQPGHPLATDRHSEVIAQLGVDAWGTVGVTRPGMNLDDGLGSSKRNSPAQHTQYPSEEGDAMVCLPRIDQPILHLGRSVSRAKKTAVFFKISHSSRS